MRMYKAKDVDEYISLSNVKARPVLKKLRQTIMKTIPKAEEGISWGVPFYKYHGLLGGFSVFTNHASFGLAFVIEDKYKKPLEKSGYVVGKKTVQIGFDQDVPVSIISKILKEKARVNEVKKLKK